jgi:ATP-dependent exoDNAse (exonuclease V) beta subunit
MKQQRGEFDISDAVYQWLTSSFNFFSYKVLDSRSSDKFDLIYIDEVQDLTVAQISLFQFLCVDPNKGLLFVGDTAQTISSGINFRFEGIYWYSNILRHAPSLLRAF